MSPRISLWESLSEDEKKKVYGGSASSYSFRLNKQTKKHKNKQKKVTSSRRYPCGYSKILFDLLLIDHCKRQ